MKTTILTLTLTAFMAATVTANLPGEPKIRVNTAKAEILDDQLEDLFEQEILGEAVFTPIYTTVEQLIFSEQVKLLKAEHAKGEEKKKN